MAQENIFTPEKLKEIFEPALVDEIMVSPQKEVPAGMQVALAGDDINAIPIILKGKVKVYRVDDKGNEITIYDMTPGQSCIISINHSMQEEKTPAFARAITDTTVILVSPLKSKEWLDNYGTWRTFVFSLYNLRLNELVEQHDVVSRQRNEIQQKSESINESIRYARRIQNAVLPPVQILDKVNIEYFIFNKPRDIVSGDFYWFAEHDDLAIIAAADATGHGVPGAFMSLLGVSFLNEITSNQSIHTASEILNSLRAKVKAITKQSIENTTNDGMDIALTVIDQKNKKMHYAGAHNPLYLIRNNKLIQIKADKMPVGNYIVEKESFTNHEIDIEPNDVIYLFSDGFADQMGGAQGRKFMTRNFRELLFDIHQKDLSEQKQKLEEVLADWQGDLDQVDDILIIGIKAK